MNDTPYIAIKDSPTLPNGRPVTDLIRYEHEMEHLDRHVITRSTLYWNDGTVDEHTYDTREDGFGDDPMMEAAFFATFDYGRHISDDDRLFFGNIGSWAPGVHGTSNPAHGKWRDDIAPDRGGDNEKYVAVLLCLLPYQPEL